MEDHCSKSPNSDPPTCHMHDVALTYCEELVDVDAPYLGYVTRLKCPISQSIVLDSHGFREHI
jgi:hypothetical protein